MSSLNSRLLSLITSVLLFVILTALFSLIGFVGFSVLDGLIGSRFWHTGSRVREITFGIGSTVTLLYFANRSKKFQCGCCAIVFIFAYFLDYGLQLRSTNRTIEAKCIQRHGEGALVKEDSLCGCRDGFEMYLQYCVTKESILACTASHGSNSYYDRKTNKCVCNDGYMLADGQCVEGESNCQTLFGQGAIFDRTKNECVCKNGYAFSATDNACILLQDSCRKKYGQYATADLASGLTCRCLEGFEFNADKTSCVCPTPTRFLDNGKCVWTPYCGLGGTFDVGSKTCTCSSTSKKIGDKCYSPDEICQKKMGNDAEYSEGLGMCMCKKGYKAIRNSDGSVKGLGCIRMSYYCATVYGPRGQVNSLKDDQCQCFGDPCKCSDERDPTDLTPCK